MTHLLSIQDFIAALNRCDDADAVHKLMLEYFRPKGFTAIARAAASVVEPNDLEFFETGFPTDFITRYREHKLHLIDPLPLHGLQTDEPFDFFEIGQKVRLTRAHHEFMAEMEQSMPLGGLILPTFGRNLHAGITTLGQPENADILRQADRIMLHAAAQQAHLRIDKIALDTQPKVTLSPRETEILFWIARGKSNGEIGTIVGVSTDTVGTYVKRLFDKLDVNDRTAAAISGLHKGLITFRTSAAGITKYRREPAAIALT